MAGPRVAIVHDWLVSPGGAEKVVLALHSIWPDAPIYTAAYEPDKFPEFAGLDVRTTWLNRIPLAKKKHQLFSIPRGWSFESLDLSDFDIVISSCSAESKYIRKGPKTLHICYCHTPIRYYWSDYDWYRQNPPFGWLNPVAAAVLPVLIPFLRSWDFRRAQKVNHFVANSKNVQQRIKKYYHRDSSVIYPPVDVDQFEVADGEGEYYLVFGRQVAYKRLDLAVDAFNRLGLPLVVAGVGEEIKVQQARSKSNIRYAGSIDEKNKAELYRKAIALVFPAEEDFGIVPVEAMASGRPVIGYGKGGVTESVVEGVTGTFFDQQTPESLIQSVKRFQSMKLDAKQIRAQAEKFDRRVFLKEIKSLIEKKYEEYTTGLSID